MPALPPKKVSKHAADSGLASDPTRTNSTSDENAKAASVALQSPTEGRDIVSQMREE